MKEAGKQRAACDLERRKLKVKAVISWKIFLSRKTNLSEDDKRPGEAISE